MLKTIETPKAPKPISNYSQGVEVAPGARYLFVAGQVGVAPDGEIPTDPRRQHELAWANVLGILEASGMDHRNIVDVHGYITARDHMGFYREVRDRVLKGHKPAATLLIVTGLADPRFVVEVAVVAAAPAT